MPRVILPFTPRLLSYPGRQAGFDPDHIASSSVRASAVPSGTGANFTSLLTGKKGTPTVSARSIDRILGPQVSIAAAGNTTNGISLNTSSLPVPAAVTMAAIFIYKSTADVNGFFTVGTG